MMTIRYNRELYAEDAVNASVALFRDFADIEITPTSTHVEVRVVPHDVARGDELVAEMNNHILGHTIELRSAEILGGGQP